MYSDNSYQAPDGRADRQFFAGALTAGAYGIWRKPANAQFAYIVCQASGGGGGGGFTRIAGAAGGGGGGGGAGAWTHSIFPLVFLPDVLHIQSGIGGAGGAAGTVGSAGAASLVLAWPAGNIATNTLAHSGNGGGAGGGGTGAAVGAAGAAGAAGALTSMPLAGMGIVQIVVGLAGSAGGAVAGAAGAQVFQPDLSNGQRSGGGSGGGGTTSADFAGGPTGDPGMGNINPHYNSRNAQAAAGSNYGGSGYVLAKPYMVIQALGGGSSNTLAGGAGGHGSFGGGGGGGGAGTTGGRGGDGGPGFVMILSW